MSLFQLVTGAKLKMKVKKGTEINVKRFYIDGVVLKEICPECGKILTTNLEEQYLSYPVIEMPEEIAFYCDDCDEYYNFKYIIEMHINKYKKGK